MRKLSKIEYERRSKYYRRGTSPNLSTCKVDKVNIDMNGGREHEHAKLDKCFDLKESGNHFLTEATDKTTKLRHDIVDLSDGIIFEIETTHARAARFKGVKGVEVIMVEE